jgi:uncharacterized protein YyaL (SSP411 family)
MSLCRLRSQFIWPVLPMLLIFVSSPVHASSGPIPWQTWSDGIFTQAAREHKFVLLNLQSGWSHWCNVMDQETYGDSSVRDLMEKSYIAVEVDQSLRPDIANRYRGNDLPTTVIYNAEGGEIVRKQGYITAEHLAALLQAVIDDPSPGPSVTPEPAILFSASPLLPPELLGAIRQEFDTQYEVPDQLSAFGVKYLDAESLEYASVLAGRGDKRQEQRVLDSLHAAALLFDPVWGGAFQSLLVAMNSADSYPVTRYARVQIAGRLDTTGDSWNDPHFEKLLFVQAQVIRIYAQAYGKWHRQEYLAAAQNVHGYVRNFLTSPDGAFYVSQNADVATGTDSVAYFALDDAGRRALGTPQIDEHLYARENGWMIEGLCTLYAVTGDGDTLREAEHSALWVIAHRSLKDGGFSHDDHDAAGPYLGDTVAMGEGFLALYQVTGNRDWLKRAETAQDFIAANFPAETGAGFVTSKTSTDRAYKPHPDRDENAQVARFANMLANYTGDNEAKETATRAMRYLATREIATDDLSAPVLLAEMQFTHFPEHITVVGGKNDAAAQALFRAALRTGISYKRVEWWDPADGPLPRADVQYPSLTYAAAFLSTSSTLSPPISDPQILATLSAKATE